MVKLEAEAQTQAQRETEEQQLRLVIGQLQEFAEKAKTGLAESDWTTRREIIRALVKRVEIDKDDVRIVYKVSPAPFAESPKWDVMQHCWRGVHADTEEVMPQARDRLGQRAYEKLLQLRIEAGEGAVPPRGGLGRGWKNKGSKPVTHLTAMGHVEVARRVWWREGQSTAVPVDEWLNGGAARVNVGARERCCRIGRHPQGVKCSAEDLRRLVGWSVSAERLR